MNKIDERRLCLHCVLHCLIFSTLFTRRKFAHSPTQLTRSPRFIPAVALNLSLSISSLVSGEVSVSKYLLNEDFSLSEDRIWICKAFKGPLTEHIVSAGYTLTTLFKSAKFCKVKNYSKMIHCFYFLSHCSSGVSNRWKPSRFAANLTIKHFKFLSFISRTNCSIRNI